MVGALGLEPRLAESESDVLPITLRPSGRPKLTRADRVSRIRRGGGPGEELLERDAIGRELFICGNKPALFHDFCGICALAGGGPPLRAPRVEGLRQPAVRVGAIAPNLHEPRMDFGPFGGYNDAFSLMVQMLGQWDQVANPHGTGFLPRALSAIYLRSQGSDLVGDQGVFVQQGLERRRVLRRRALLWGGAADQDRDNRRTHHRLEHTSAMPAAKGCAKRTDEAVGGSPVRPQTDVQEGFVRIRVDSLPRDGRTIAFSEKVEWASEAAKKALEGPIATLAGELRIERRGKLVHVSGTVRTATFRACERCSEEVPVALELAPSLDYRSAEDEAAEGAEPEVALGSDELDVGWFAGDEIDVADVLCEAIALGLPARVACAETAACDARTEKLLAERGKSGEAGGSTFSVLKNLH